MQNSRSTTDQHLVSEARRVNGVTVPKEKAEFDEMCCPMADHFFTLLDSGDKDGAKKLYAYYEDWHPPSITPRVIQASSHAASRTPYRLQSLMLEIVLRVSPPHRETCQCQQRCHQRG